MIRSARPTTSVDARAATSMVIAFALAGCANTRWIDRFTSFDVDVIDAARIDALDARSPSRHPSTRWIWYTSDKANTFADCQYWRAVKLNGAKDSAAVRRYVEAREQFVCSSFRDVFEGVTQADFERKVASRTERMKDEGEPFHGSIDPVAPLHFDVERGKCYVLVFRLDQGVAATEEAKQHSSLQAFSEGAGFLGMQAVNAAEAIASEPFGGHGAVLSLGCPTAKGSMRIEANPPHLGKGSYSAQLESIAHSEAQYEADEKGLERAMKESAVYKAQRLREVCAECAESLRDCSANPITPGFDCKGAYAECIEVNASAHPADCSP